MVRDDRDVLVEALVLMSLREWQEKYVDYSDKRTPSYGGLAWKLRPVVRSSFSLEEIAAHLGWTKHVTKKVLDLMKAEHQRIKFYPRQAGPGSESKNQWGPTTATIIKAFRRCVAERDEAQRISMHLALTSPEARAILDADEKRATFAGPTE